MSLNIKVVIILIILILLCSFLYIRNTEYLYIESSVDNNKYLIRKGNIRSKDHLQESANTLAKINTHVVKLINHLDSKYKYDNTRNYFIKKLKQNYNYDILSEAAIDKRYTTYTINKSDMHVCLRTRDSYEHIYDLNTLMYVILHELAHLCNYNQYGEAIQGHGEEFKQIFKFLIIESINLGIYKYEDYTERPQEYCGIIINTTILPKTEYFLL